MPKQRGQPGPGNAAVTYAPPPTPPGILSGFLPAFLDLSFLPRAELCPADLFLPGPLTSFCSYQGLQVCLRSSSNLKHGIIAELEAGGIRKIFLEHSGLLRSGIWAIGLQVVDGRPLHILGSNLWASSGTPSTQGRQCFARPPPPPRPPALGRSRYADGSVWPCISA